MKIYLSSTYEDLKQYRETVYHALEKAGHEVAWMEHYVARDKRPVDKCLSDVDSADLYVGLLGLRYGYVPPPDHNNPCRLSITELEFNRARENEHVEVLAFVLDKRVKEWPDRFKDSVTGENGAGESIDRLRSYVLREMTTPPFTTPDKLASDVLAAVNVLEREIEAHRHEPPSGGNVPPLSGREVFERNFEHMDAAKKERARQHFESLKSVFALDHRYLMGDEDRTAGIVIPEQFAVYFEGMQHFLKLQTYPLPEGAVNVRAVAVGDETGVSFMDANPTWVVLERNGEFRLIRHQEDTDGLYWRLAPVYASSRLFIVAEYLEARPLAIDGIMDIWIEVDDLAGEFSSITVAFGGQMPDVRLVDAYQLHAIRSLKFYPIDTSALERVDDALETACVRFSPVIAYLQGAGHLDDAHGVTLRQLWDEFRWADPAALQAVRVPNVQADLLVVVAT